MIKSIKFSSRQVDCWSGYSSTALTTHARIDGKWKIVGKSALPVVARELRDRIQGNLANGSDVEREESLRFCGIEIKMEDANNTLNELKDNHRLRRMAR
jgi:hypothetical protein